MLWRARLRGQKLFGRQCIRRAARLTANQPLLLIREPTNPVDTNAIIAADLFGKPVGYIERGVAAVVAPFLDNGVIVMATATGTVIEFWPIAQLWIDGDQPEAKKKRRVIIDRNRRTIKAARPSRVGIPQSLFG